MSNIREIHCRCLHHNRQFCHVCREWDAGRYFEVRHSAGKLYALFNYEPDARKFLGEEDSKEVREETVHYSSHSMVMPICGSRSQEPGEKRHSLIDVVDCIECLRLFIHGVRVVGEKLKLVEY